ncbi:hypothetical protein [Allosalinactinospora lopnorensis]|uniref:hypothetical protein n=1 Tax=Allosalinactinospora lopnorensis TaxID=1352348 RepID=UPI000623D677|nr:hypothetical protein [Allosalinactinospora lopnorensis]
MATYRIQTTDGAQRTQRAQLMRTDANTLHFDDRIGGAWHTVLTLPLTEVDHVQRRFTENDGKWVWLTEQLPAPADTHA